MADVVVSIRLRDSRADSLTVCLDLSSEVRTGVAHYLTVESPDGVLCMSYDPEMADESIEIALARIDAAVVELRKMLPAVDRFDKTVTIRTDLGLINGEIGAWRCVHEAFKNIFIMQGDLDFDGETYNADLTIDFSDHEPKMVWRTISEESGDRVTSEALLAEVTDDALRALRDWRKSNSQQFDEIWESGLIATTGLLLASAVSNADEGLQVALAKIRETHAEIGVDASDRPLYRQLRRTDPEINPYDHAEVSAALKES